MIQVSLLELITQIVVESGIYTIERREWTGKARRHYTRVIFIRECDSLALMSAIEIYCFSRIALFKPRDGNAYLI